MTLIDQRAITQSISEGFTSEFRAARHLTGGVINICIAADVSHSWKCVDLELVVAKVTCVPFD